MVGRPRWANIQDFLQTQALITLRQQYRMAGDIMSVANALIYNGQLQCGSEAVEQAVLALDRPTHEAWPDWLRQVHNLILPTTCNLLCVVSSICSKRKLLSDGG
jgi:hypothetical protein